MRTEPHTRLKGGSELLYRKIKIVKYSLTGKMKRGREEEATKMKARRKNTEKSEKE